MRCNLKLEVPVADGGAVLVSDKYLRYLVDFANQKWVLLPWLLPCFPRVRGGVYRYGLGSMCGLQGHNMRRAKP